jgi:hypothetical protein
MQRSPLLLATSPGTARLGADETSCAGLPTHDTQLRQTMRSTELAVDVSK